MSLVSSRPTARTVSPSTGKICQSGLSEKLATEYVPACSLSLLKTVFNSRAETACICSAQSWWHHPQRCRTWWYAKQPDSANVLLQAINRSEVIRDQTKLIIFLGTPHRGSAFAGWGQIASNLARLALQDSNQKLLRTLEVNSEVLDNIHEGFKKIVFKRTIKIHSFREERGITGMHGLENKVCSCRHMLCTADNHKTWLTAAGRGRLLI